MSNSMAKGLRKSTLLWPLHLEK